MGQRPGEAYSACTLKLVVKQAAERAGIRWAITLHMLRYSYVTHLLEAGTAFRFIQGLPGNNSIKSTGIYTHLAQHNCLTSPLNSLGL